MKEVVTQELGKVVVKEAVMEVEIVVEVAKITCNVLMLL